MLHAWHSFDSLRFSHIMIAPVAKQARGSHDRTKTELFYISSSNQPPPLVQNDLVEPALSHLQRESGRSRRHGGQRRLLERKGEGEKRRREKNMWRLASMFTIGAFLTA